MDYKSKSGVELVSQRSILDNDESPTADSGVRISLEKIAESYKPIFLALKFGSFEVGLPPVPPKILLRIYCGILFLLSWISAALVVYNVYKFARDLITSNKQKGLLYVDHIVTLIIFVNYLSRRDKLLVILERATVILQSLAQRDKDSMHLNGILLRTIHRWATVLSLGCFFHFLINCILATTQTAFQEQLPLYSRMNFTDSYFGIYVNGYISVAIVSATENFVYHLLMLCTNLYVALILIVFILLFCCFQQLNRNMSSKTETNSRDMSYFQTEHEEIGRLVRMANEVFSPIILIILLTKIVQLVCSFNTMRDNLYSMSFGSPDFVRNAMTKSVEMMIYGTAIGTIILLTTVGGKLFDEAEESINVMLNMNLENSGSIKDDQLEMSKSCHITTLFTANCTTTPVGITASGLFNFNYKLMAVIIPAIITGITHISEI